MISISNQYTVKNGKFNLPLGGAVNCSQKIKQPPPAIAASVFAYSAPLMHGFHERLACVPGELGSLWPAKKKGR